MLILSVPVMYGDVVLYLFFDKNVTIIEDNEIENLIEDNLPDTNTDTIDQTDIYPILSIDIIEIPFLFSYKNISYFLVNGYSNICLQQKNPPP
ncbi:hypothetical protein VB796_22605 [Arcicella sp. LKC2W]|uniref:hypothetical protein n=1 Tax=Arcicella sp. LKC2W TaxID=2984198 RepID=UPI002B1FDC23|nr:hypothetical protein [Arcicella sp. LKC2W]MEA5461878.1 hypothetical protein [Arcicella sp. LKC2W]